MEEPDLYEILQVSPKASPIVIKKAYRALLLENHPDRGGSDARAHQLNEAYRVLSDPRSREAYDQGRADPEPLVLLVCPRCGVLNRVRESQLGNARCGRCSRGMASPPAKKTSIQILLLLLVGFLGFGLGKIPFEAPVSRAKLAAPLRLVQKADALVQQNRFAQAVPLYKKALALEPRNAGTAYALGMACQLDRQFDGAIQAYEQALLIDSRHRRALISLGDLFREAGKLDEALKLFKEASMVEHEDPEIHLRMAEILLLNGDNDGAVREFHLCLEQSKSNPILAERAARALREMGAP